MFKLPHNCTHLTCQQSNAQNFPSEASIVRELRTSRCSSWIQKRQKNQDQIANIGWIIEEAREFQKNVCFSFIDYTKAFDCVVHNKPWKILKDMRVSDHLTCLLKNLYSGQVATVGTGHGTTNWFQIGKGVCQTIYCHPAYLTYTQSISCELPSWIKHKLESRLPGEISIN